MSSSIWVANDPLLFIPMIAFAREIASDMDTLFGMESSWRMQSVFWESVNSFGLMRGGGRL